MELAQPQLDGWKKNNKFPILFLEKNGKTRAWACWVEGNTVYRTDGFTNGKMKDPLPHAYTGNSVKSPEEQAGTEAEKVWLKQIDKDYRPSAKDKYGQKIFQHVKEQKERNGGMNRGVRLFEDSQVTGNTTAGSKKMGSQHRPMLAKKYKDWVNEELVLTNPGKKISFPAIAQAKVDGMRALPVIDGKNVMLESRNGNSFVFLEHVKDEIRSFLTKAGCPDIVLDGELYVHQLYVNDGTPTLDKNSREMKSVERYQFCSEACKITRKKAHPHQNFIQYWIFDIWDPTMTNTDRWNKLQELFKGYKGSILKLVPTRIVNSHSEIEEFMCEMTGETNGREGYEFEGLMVRDSGATYKSSTTHQSCLLKYKRFEDEEWTVIGAEQCNGGTQDGAIKWICEKEINGTIEKVTAKQMGDTSDSKKLWKDYQKNPKKFIGRSLNIRFNDRSKKNVPRFPRATAFVEDK